MHCKDSDIYMKQVHLGNGMSALVDNTDYDNIRTYSWHAVKYPKRNTWYAVTAIGGKTVQMHRLILGLCADDPQVDHANCYGLDNQRHNIRIATGSQNAMNRPPKQGRRFKGIYKTTTGKWAAKIQTPGNEQHYLGVCTLPEDAARLYDAAAMIYFGEFAYLNFP